MDYADVVLAGIVAVFALSIAVFVALGLTTRTSISIGSMGALALMFHAMFVNPPGRGDRR